MIPYLADGLVRHVGWELIFTVGMATGAQKPLLILTPILAETLARAGSASSTSRPCSTSTPASRPGSSSV